MKGRISSILLVLPLCCVLSCGGGGGGTHEDAEELVRVIHAAPDAPALSVYFNKLLFARDVQYGEATVYDTAPEGDKVDVEVKGAASVLPLIDSEQKIESGKQYSLILYEDEGSNSVKLLLQADDNGRPQEEQLRLRIGDLASSLTSCDVYIVRPGVSIRNSAPVKSGLGFTSFTDYFELDPGDYEIKITEAGTDDLVAESGVVTLLAGDVRTFYVLDQRGGGNPIRSRMLLDFAY